MLKGKNIIVGVCGGIAAYKVCELVQQLKYRGAEATVVMTKNACEFVTPLTFQTLSGRPVYTEMFRLINEEEWQVEHVELGKKCDLMVIAPATANILGKLAAGMADDPLTTTALCVRAPVLICPAMNTAMWNNGLVKDNVDKLKKFGYKFIGPGAGKLACGDTGKGRLEDIEKILEVITEIIRRGQ
ncbi:MAG: bifunctional phosphopantothenoylcysteine decarboxylase/phosphopantothenate--cysteine ligase CoaBC [Candidatus Firestonebacteria bacterium]|nr:bifunctional phosphopantothenoylcysteine decarboxylase/phosphopantothenate--cysteine ligase CoaBC [Candidatus Firestonebacteria bacterium]